MSDIIRMARAMYGPAYDRMAADAGSIKAEYLAAGGKPEHVVSPERLKALRQHGASGLLNCPSEQRKDGSIAAPYVPTDMALSMNMIEPKAVPAVLTASRAGVNTVSSGVDRQSGRGFAIGRAPSGHVVRVEK